MDITQRTGSQIIEDVLRANNIDPVEFVKTYITWYFKRDFKKNTFALIGPSNTGKSLFCNLAMSNRSIGYAIVQGIADFELMDLVDRNFGILHEMDITQRNFQMLKLVCGGETCPVNVKMKAMKHMPRIPIFATMNEGWDRWLTPGGSAQMENRMFKYQMNAPFPQDIEKIQPGDWEEFVVRFIDKRDRNDYLRTI